MTRKLVAPGITGGEWLFKKWGDYFKLYDAAQELTFAHTFFRTKEDAANARFLAGSKRTSAAAAAILNKRSENQYANFEAEIDELRAALLAQGYREEDAP